MIRYSIFHNQTARFMRGAEAGDLLIAGWVGIMDVSSEHDLSAVEAVFREHNRDCRPDGRLAPSLSIGDVVVITTYDDQPICTRTIEGMGTDEFDLSTAEVVEGPWVTVVDAVQARLIAEGRL